MVGKSKRLVRFGRLEPEKIACQDQDGDKSGLKSALAVDRIPLHARLFRPNIAALAGYTPGEQPSNDGFIKLNTNENPYPPSPKVYAALRRAINPTLRLYPEPLSDTLRSTAAKLYGVAPSSILAGNGSDEILSMLLRCFVGPRDRVAFPVPTYSLYDTLVAIQDGRAARSIFRRIFPCRKH